MSAGERAFASTAEYSAAGNYILTYSLKMLPAGDVVELGTFTANFNFAPILTNYTATNAGFTLYSTTTIGALLSGLGAGQFAALTGNLDSTTAAGKQLYVWVFNTNAPSTATGWVIITDTAANWIGPATGTTATALDTSDVNTFVPAGALGSRVTDTTAPSGENFIYAVGAVPEPSTVMILGGAAGLMSLHLLRRRRSA